MWDSVSIDFVFKCLHNQKYLYFENSFLIYWGNSLQSYQECVWCFGKKGMAPVMAFFCGPHVQGNDILRVVWNCKLTVSCCFSWPAKWYSLRNIPAINLVIVKQSWYQNLGRMGHIRYHFKPMVKNFYRKVNGMLVILMPPRFKNPMSTNTSNFWKILSGEFGINLCCQHVRAHVGYWWWTHWFWTRPQRNGWWGTIHNQEESSISICGTADCLGGDLIQSSAL